MREGYWAVATVVAGGIGEKTKFWVDGVRPDRRAKRKEQAELRKIKQNESSARKELARLINANFTEGDLLLGLDYSPEGLARLEKAAGLDSSASLRFAQNDGTEEWTERDDRIRDQAEHQLALCLRRVSRLLQKDGRELYYVGITSDMDGDTGEKVRVHHHLIVPKGTEQAFVEKWEKLGLGGVSWTPLRAGQIDRSPIAEYLLRQVRRIKDANKYTSSRNLVRPKAKVRAVATDAFLRAPKDCTVLPGTLLRPDAQYLVYQLPPEQVEAAEEVKRRRREKLCRAA